MSIPKTVLKSETALPLIALLAASAAGVALVACRVAWTGNWRYLYLVWNLFLAWLPLCFSLAAHRRYHRHTGAGAGWRLWTLAALWLLFFPNAPYIFTDVVHLTTHFWVDLSLVLLVALTGFVLGFISLYLMHGVMTHKFGAAAGWIFIPCVSALAGFGIYLGRFLRWNSWNVLTNPVAMSRDVGRFAAHPLANPASSIAFPALFAIFLFFGYVMLYALTRLRPPQRFDFAAS